MVAVLQKSLIKHSLQTFYRSMKDLDDNDKLFGAIVLLPSGDFRQTLRVHCWVLETKITMSTSTYTHQIARQFLHCCSDKKCATDTRQLVKYKYSSLLIQLTKK